MYLNAIGYNLGKYRLCICAMASFTLTLSDTYFYVKTMYCSLNGLLLYTYVHCCECYTSNQELIIERNS